MRMRSLHPLLKPLQLAWRGWMAFSHALGLVMSTIVLTLLWIVGFGSYAIAFRIACICKRSVVQTSYWNTSLPQRREDLLRQF